MSITSDCKLFVYCVDFVALRAVLIEEAAQASRDDSVCPSSYPLVSFANEVLTRVIPARRALHHQRGVMPAA